MSRNPKFNRRNFLKKATAAGTVGVVGITAITGSASAATYTLEVYGSGPADYWVHGYDEYPDLQKAPAADGGDTANGDEAYGTVAGGSDTYYHNGRLYYFRVTNGTGSTDDWISFSVTEATNNILVTASNSQSGPSWNYYVSTTDSISKGNEAEGNDTVVNGDTVEGNINAGYQDDYNYSGDNRLY